MDLEAAIDLAINEMPDEFVIKEFIVGNQAEVKKMFLTEYDEKKEMELGKLDTIEQERERIAKDMIEAKEPMEKIIKYTKLPLESIISIANQNGLGFAEPAFEKNIAQYYET